MVQPDGSRKENGIWAKRLEGTKAKDAKEGQCTMHQSTKKNQNG
jgi:hypothetical protein